MNRKANVAVIGAGGIANNVHLPSLSEIEEANVVAVCDLEERAKRLEKYSITVYTSMYKI